MECIHSNGLDNAHLAPGVKTKAAGAHIIKFPKLLHGLATYNKAWEPTGKKFSTRTELK